MDVFVDFETRSLADLPRTGAWKYAAHPSTYPLMLAAIWDNGRRLQWLEYVHGRECPKWVHDIAADPGLIVHAHNCNFEIAIWERVLVQRWGWPSIPRERWRDTAALAAHANLPRDLAGVAKFLRVAQKDAAGKELIKLLSQPRKAVKAKKDADGELRKDNVDYLKSKGVEFFTLDPMEDPVYYWENDRSLLAKFARYNEQDVVVEAQVDSGLPPFTWREQDVWTWDSEMNERGIPIDRELCEAARELFEHEESRAQAEMSSLTGGEVTKATQNARLLKWIKQRVKWGDSLAREIVDNWLEHFPNDPTDNQLAVRDALKARDILGGAAIKKYVAALNYADDDDRARGQVMYYGASTGRWAGKGIQVHNFARVSQPEEDVFDLVKTANHDAVSNYCKTQGIEVTELLKRCVRGLIKAPDGRSFIVSDFAGIESRVLQWLAGAEDVLDLFRQGRDLYVHTAAGIFGRTYDEMMGPDGVLAEYKQERQIGKICVLALGYSMGWRTYQRNCSNWGVDITDEFAQMVVEKWRETNPRIADWSTGLWTRVERAFRAVVANPKITAKIDNGHGVSLRIGKDAFDAVWVELPSGRRLYYPKAHLSHGRMNDRARGISYNILARRGETEPWERSRLVYCDGGKSFVDTYGGKLIENIVQAISRDLLVESALAAESAGLFLIFHVHDELVAEEADDRLEWAKETLHRVMSTPPEWAVDLPLAAETYVSKRYTK